MTEDEPFFLPPPEPEEIEEGPQFYPDFPWMPPVNVVGRIVALDREVARTEDTVLVLRWARHLGRGLELALEWWVRPGTERAVGGVRGWADEWPRFGVLLADGTALGREAGDPHGGPGPDRTGSPDGPGLANGGGSGGGPTGAQQWWVWPVPQESFEVVVAWPARGVPETRVTVDAAPLVAAGDEVSELWPMPEAPEGEFGWFAYAPKSGAAYGSRLSLSLDDDDGEDRAPDEEE